jgi:UDPglucose 6-dehydrogenase
MAERLARAGRDDLRFSCVPENLRLGEALRTFRDPERFVVGSPEGEARAALETLLAPFGAPLEWMAIESAEMTKHALNAFLATSVAFINEIATICEAVGADAAEVSRGLMSEQRIGPRAYLRPGDAFAGGTLARDISFLAAIARENGLRAPLVEGVTSSNELHRGWSLQALLRLLAAPERRQQPHPLAGRRVALWGLTYKPGTDTLRRSSALELARSLVRAGAEIRAHDPTIKELPPPDAAIIELAGDPLGALRDADALVLCTPWPEYRTIEAGEVRAAMAEALVVDPGGHLLSTLGHDPHVRYARVGVLPR